MPACSVVAPPEQVAEGRLQLEVDLLHDLGDERFLRAEVVEQHPSTGPDRGGERSKGKMSDTVPEKIGKAIIQELFSRIYVTVVTLTKLDRQRNEFAPA